MAVTKILLAATLALVVLLPVTVQADGLPLTRGNYTYVDREARHMSPLRPADGAAFTLVRSALKDATAWWDAQGAIDYDGCHGAIDTYVAQLPADVQARYYPGTCALAIDRAGLADDLTWVHSYRRHGHDRSDALESLRAIWVTVTHEVGHARLGPTVCPGCGDEYHAPGHANIMSTDGGRGAPAEAYAWARRTLPYPLRPAASRRACRVETYGSGYQRTGLELVCDGEHVRWIRRPRPPASWPKPDPQPTTRR